MAFPHGFGTPLLDFAFFVLFAYYADTQYKPAAFYRWIFFILCAVLALLFFVAWLIDLGAHV